MSNSFGEEGVGEGFKVFGNKNCLFLLYPSVVCFFRYSFVSHKHIIYELSESKPKQGGNETRFSA